MDDRSEDMDLTADNAQRDVHATDVLIVGAGPIGLELAVALKGAGVPYVQVDAASIGHTITGYPRQARFFSSPERIAIAGVPLVTVDQSKTSREEYLAYLRGVVDQFNLDVRTFERVVEIRVGAEGPGRFRVTTQSSGGTQRYEARRVVLAIGDMADTRRLDIPGEDLPHVSHLFDEPHRYFRRRLLIVGGKNSAVEAAIRCHRAGARVSLSYRGERFPEKSVKYWLLPEIESFVAQGHIKFLPRTVPVVIDATKVSLSRLDEPAGSDLLQVPADFVLLLVGYRADTTLFEMAGVTLEGENRGPRHDPATMETDVPGLYVAGTAAAGTQHHFKLFIENSHVHVDRILSHLTGRPLPTRVARGFSLPES
ncbi:MAG: NAD(P)-binding domain-containing protein [Candidatus Eisenbacteria bacterium]|nr:NAD(P)-binding domain-containing protein [Candidatus Eisenbacteria bacterium]